jgi:diguanylate cyclase (GGDEF)-like protein/PAS domain S-box-containing protein
MTQAFRDARTPLARMTIDGMIENANLAFEDVVGRTAAELIGRSITEFWCADLFEPEVRFVEKMDSVEGMIVDAAPSDGASGLPSVSIRFVPMDPASGHDGLIGVYLVTDDERQRKIDLSSGSAGFQMSFDQIGVGMSITMIDGSSMVNDALCELVGRTREEIAAVTLFSLFHPEDRTQDFELGTRAFAGEIDGWTREKRMIRSDGVIVWVLETVTMIRDEDGEPVHFLSQCLDIGDRKRAEAERDEAEERATFMADGIPVGMIHIKADGTITSANARLISMLGRDPVGSNLTDFMAMPDLERAAAAIEASPGSENEWRLEFPVGLADGTTRWIRAHSRCHYEADGQLKSVTAAWTDVTDEVDARRTSERFAELLEAVDDLIAIVNPDGTVVHLNHAARAQRGGQPTSEELLDLFEPADAVRIRDEGLRTALAEGTWTGEVSLVAGSGRGRFVSLSLVAHRDARGEVECFSAITRDISELKEAQERLRVQASTDVLTGLPNRADFSDRLGRALARTVRTGGVIAVLFVDLDRFKAVNDSWGHEAGDELLIQVAERLVQAVRTGDTVARVGGDEFVVLAEPVRVLGEARPIGERIVAALAEPFELSFGTVGIGASVGLAMSTPDSTVRSIVRAADLASMKAKATGRSRLVLADPELAVAAVPVTPGTQRPSELDTG